MRTYTTEHITVRIYDMQPPAWVWTREAKLAWMTCRPWRMQAQDATVGNDNYQAYRAYLLKQAYAMFSGITSIADEPTEKVPVVKRTITMRSGATGQGLLSFYNQDTVKVRAVR